MSYKKNLIKTAIFSILILSGLNQCVIADNLNSSNLRSLDAGALQKSNEKQLQGEQVEKRFINTMPTNAPIKPESKSRMKEAQIGDYIVNPEFLLNKITFEGNNIYNNAVLQDFSKEFLNKYISMDDILYLTAQISNFYQSNGYLTSYAFIPPQEVTNGEIKIHIIESPIEGILVQNNHWARSSYLINGILGADDIKQNKVFDAKKLQLALKELNSQDYLKVQVQVARNQNNQTQLALNVKDRCPIGFNVLCDNYGRALTGRNRTNLILKYDNVTGFGDKVYGGAILADGTRGALAGYEIPVGKHGTKLGFDYSASAVKLGKQYKSDDITGFSSNYSFRITQPIYKTVNTEIIAVSSLDALKSKTKFNSLNETLSDYELRVIRTGIYALHDDNKGRWISSLGSDFGAKFLGASPNISGGPSSSFFNLKTATTRIQRLPKRCLGIAKISGQYSPNRMFASEQMQLGGPYSLRGYEPGVILGDYGIMGTMELRTPIPGLAKILPSKVKHWEEKVQFTTFYDWGYVKEHGNLYGYPQNFLHSAGVGLHFNLTNYISAAFNAAMPLGEKMYNENTLRFNFSINTEVDKFFFKPLERI